MFDPDKWLEIGKVVAPQGLRGEMRVYPNTDFPERFLEPGERWLLRPGSTDIEPVHLLGGRFLAGKGLYIIQLEGITSREHVEELRNSRLWVPEGDRPTLEAGEFHVADLVGLAVYHQVTGEWIGTVKDVFPAGNDLLEVEIMEGDRSPADSSNRGTEASSSVNEESITPNQRKSAKTKKKRSRSGTSSGQKTVLIPFVHAIVPVVDLTNRRIEVLPPHGLL